MTRTVSGLPLWEGTVIVEPGFIFSSAAVSSVTAASTSRVSAPTSPWATGQRPALSRLCSVSADGTA